MPRAAAAGHVAARASRSRAARRRAERDPGRPGSGPVRRQQIFAKQVFYTSASASQNENWCKYRAGDRKPDVEIFRTHDELSKRTKRPWGGEQVGASSLLEIRKAIYWTTSLHIGGHAARTVRPNGISSEDNLGLGARSLVGKQAVLSKYGVAEKMPRLYYLEAIL